MWSVEVPNVQRALASELVWDEGAVKRWTITACYLYGKSGGGVARERSCKASRKASRTFLLPSLYYLKSSTIVAVIDYENYTIRKNTDNVRNPQQSSP